MKHVLSRPASFPVHSFQGIYTVAPEMMSLFEVMERAARSDAPTLIQGEVGTGKELVAHALHQMSRRCEHPFDSVNCTAMRAEVMGSELFGHTKGAFAGAISDYPGRLRRVHRGTLFIDGVADMPGEVQAGLLRVFEENTLVPVGTTRPSEIDVRIMSATRDSLLDAVEQNAFRAELLYRLRVLSIFVPPLRDRTGDVEALLWLFVEQFSRIEGDYPVRGIWNDARDALLSHHWPGNVLELRNVIEHAVVMMRSDAISIADLPPEFRGDVPSDVVEATTTASKKEAGRIKRALASASGDREVAAKTLQMSRATLWRKMKVHGIHWPRKRRRS